MVYSGTAVLFFFLMGAGFGALAHKFYQELDDEGGGDD